MSDNVQPRGFQLVRTCAAGSCDPVEGIEWTPPKESDELYEALRKAFPARKTHRERMCEALMQFLAEELGGVVQKDRHEVKTLKKHSAVAAKLAPSLSQAPRGEAVPAKGIISATPDHGVEPANKRQKVGKAWADMTVVWKSDVGLTTGARPRRMMNEDERADYRVRRAQGACSACKRKKRKCNHDQGLPPSSSSNTPGTLPSSPPLRPHGGVHDSQLELSASAAEPTSVRQSGNRGATSSAVASTTKVLRSVASPPRHHQPLDMRYHLPVMSSLASHHDWQRLEATPLESRKQVYHDESDSILQLDGLFPCISSDPLLADIWNINTSNLHGDTPFNLPAFEPFMSSEMLQTAITPVNILDSIAQKQVHKTSKVVDDADAYRRPFAQFDNSWAQAQGQGHVEQWLDQKMMEEYSVAAHPEMVPYHDKALGDDTVTSSPQRRRVKFDFASLIDGPPTLSNPSTDLAYDPAVLPYDQQEQRTTDRAPRSTSRHSTASRLSFSDIISLSSALTSLSMKDGESRRGSTHSAASEKALNDESQDEVDMLYQLGSNGSDVASGSSASDEALQDVVDWTQWNTRRNQAVLAL